MSCWKGFHMFRVFYVFRASGAGGTVGCRKMSQVMFRRVGYALSRMPALFFQQVSRLVEVTHLVQAWQQSCAYAFCGHVCRLRFLKTEECTSRLEKN